jgi:hypothetical protein
LGNIVPYACDPDQFRKTGTSFNLICMVKKLKVDPKGQTMLSRAEMKNISGGSILETVVKMVLSGAEYCFRLGIREAQRVKAQL